MATGFALGRLPIGTATPASALGIPLAFLLYRLLGWAWFLPALAILWIVGIPLCARAAELLGKEDPKEVTYDEIVTVPIAYFLVPHFSLAIIVAGFTLHRIFDIIKPFGIRRLERLGGGLGIMSDDLAAGALASIFLQTFIYLGVVR